MVETICIRVTPVESKKPRILVTLNYNEEEGIMLSENARMTFLEELISDD